MERAEARARRPGPISGPSGYFTAIRKNPGPIFYNAQCSLCSNFANQALRELVTPRPESSNVPRRLTGPELEYESPNSLEG